MITKILFRLVRNPLIAALRKKGHTWTFINKVLRATGQKVITSVEYQYMTDRISIHFAKPGPDLRKTPKK